MPTNLVAILYLLSALLFIFALRGLSNPETSRRGNIFGMFGMFIAIFTTLMFKSVLSYVEIGSAILVGGAIGTISLAIFGNITFGGLGIDNIGEQLLIQIKGVGAVIIWSAVGTYIIVKICQSITGLRVSDEDINHGLDKAEHGETSYNFN